MFTLRIGASFSDTPFQFSSKSPKTHRYKRSKNPKYGLAILAQRYMMRATKVIAKKYSDRLNVISFSTNKARVGHQRLFSCRYRNLGMRIQLCCVGQTSRLPQGRQDACPKQFRYYLILIPYPGIDDCNADR